ncbi:M81 family metallopeptidase [Paenibacillus sp. R14(2021)]|uniref:M81 family metallopeptidase n=1 Tax=Paenibacillus sp. R14(2021) TaxID=2859228 RepID=UPI001C613DF2|nr:M81 family metallopeptidase [Paenibacillus sp. R14(2021)]
MRIAVAGMMHETNTFTSLRTGLADFTLAEGSGVYAVERWRGTVFDGVLRTLADLSAEVLPVYFARALPSGLVEAAAFEAIIGRIASGIAACGPIDGICLALHGSMCAEGYDDAEGELLGRIREIAGADMPIVCALDMHATITAAMMEQANAFAAYRTAPHIDEFDTGRRAAAMLHESITTGIRLANAWLPIPVLLAGEQSETGVQPMQDLMEALRREDLEPGVRSASYLLGFPWADSPFGGCAAVVSGRADELSQLHESAKRLADMFWGRRHDFAFSTEAATLEEAIDRAVQEPNKPVILSDSGDNPTAGASQDVALIVQTLIERGVQHALVAAIYDPGAVLTCTASGVGEEAHLMLGRLHPDEASPSPLPLAVTVMQLGTVMAVNYAVVQTADGGVTVVLCDKRTAVYDPGILEQLGLILASYDIIAVKSGYLSPAYKALAARTILALTPGDTNERLAELPYERLPRPIYPLDSM